MSSLEFVNVAILCVAINAYPPLAHHLQKLAKSTTADEDIQRVLSEHGGKRFSERDNKDDLAVLKKHLVLMMMKARQKQNLPLFMDRFKSDQVPCIQKLLSDLMIPGNADSSSTRSGKQWCWQVDCTKDSFCQSVSPSTIVDILDSRWDFEDDSAPDLIVYKHDNLDVSLVEDITTLVLGTKSKSSEKQQQEEQEKLEKLKKAQKQYEKIVDLLEAIGIPDTASSGKDILQSLKFLQNWLTTFQAEEGDEITYGLVMRIQDTLSQSMDTWDILLTNVDKAKETSKANIDKLTSAKKYVLRAFLLKTCDNPESISQGDKENNKDQYVMVRRFGKYQGPSHYSILWSDGRCWPTSLKDPNMKGKVIESMWVCVDNDDECIADRNGIYEPMASTINTVVADPDDDIFCSICISFESFSYNQIVICDGCERGYHQMCHDPVIMEDELNLDVWRCRDCKRGIKRSNAGSEASGSSSNKRPNTDSGGSINQGSGNSRGTRSARMARRGGKPVQMSQKNKSRNNNKNQQSQQTQQRINRHNSNREKMMLS